MVQLRLWKGLAGTRRTPRQGAPQFALLMMPLDCSFRSGWSISCPRWPFNRRECAVGLMGWLNLLSHPFDLFKIGCGWKWNSSSHYPLGLGAGTTWIRRSILYLAPLLPSQRDLQRIRMGCHHDRRLLLFSLDHLYFDNAQICAKVQLGEPIPQTPYVCTPSFGSRGIFPFLSPHLCDSCWGEGADHFEEEPISSTLRKGEQ